MENKTKNKELVAEYSKTDKIKLLQVRSLIIEVYDNDSFIGITTFSEIVRNIRAKQEEREQEGKK